MGNAASKRTATHNFYKKVLKILIKSQIPFLVGGTFAFRLHTGIVRETKDLDLFCKAGDYLSILKILSEEGVKTEVTDARWLAKILQGKNRGKNIVDLIFGTTQGIVPVDDSWFENPHPAKILGLDVQLVPPEEMIWSKSYRGERTGYEGPDVNHLILKFGQQLDWKKLLNRMDAHWELLFTHILSFRFVYPSERNKIPGWLVEELIRRLTIQINSPLPKEKITRGHLLGRDSYKVDTEELGFKSIT